MPGASALESARVIAGELPDLVHVVELPARGPGADMIGRTGGMLAEVSSHFALETTPSGWRVAGASGRDRRRAAAFLVEDLDALEETTQGYTGPVKTQIAGPWTLAASIELRGGERILRDPSAVADLAQAVALASAEHVAAVRRRIPGASAILVQVDEPGLSSVLAGHIGTASGLSSYRAVDIADARHRLTEVFTAITGAGAVPGVHCCADVPPVDLVREAGAAFVGVDLGRADSDEALGRALEAGVVLLAGSIPSRGQGAIGDAEGSAPIRGLLHRLGLTDERHRAHVVVTPTCGLAGATPDWARTALAATRSAARVLRDDQDHDDS
jgi:methionine synthase II (cobalamin-independent)